MFYSLNKKIPPPFKISALSLLDYQLLFGNENVECSNFLQWHWPHDIQRTQLL